VELFGAAVLALAAANLVFIVVLAIRRLFLASRERRRAVLEERLRPLALELLEAGRAPRSLSPQESAAFAAILGRYARRVRGDARIRIAGFFEQSGGVEQALARLGHRRSWVRAEAAFILGDIGSRTAVPSLMQALDDPDRDVRSAAARSLGRLGAVDAVEPLVSALVGERIPQAVVGSALLAIGPDAVPRLLQLVGHPEWQERAGAVELVGLLGHAADSRVLIGALLDEASEVRARAALALGRLAAEDAAAAVRELLQDADAFVRTAAAEALAAIGDRSALESLVVQARDDLFEPADAAAEAVRRIDSARLRDEATNPSRAGIHLVEYADGLTL
jgi:HEAT repeat protein